jgi:flavorubredoxin
MSNNIIEKYRNSSPDYNDAILLFSDNSHEIYWLGIPEHTAFRSNTYLIKSGDEGIIVDPGHRAYFGRVFERVKKIMDPSQISGLILCHQDPDVAASMTDWLNVKPDMKIISSPRTHVLLPYYHDGDYAPYDVVEQPVYRFSSGHEIEFIEAPFLHFAGAFVTYDRTSQFLLSGDIWAAIQMDWQLIVNDFEEHQTYLDMFHIDYMASNIACKGFVEKIRPLSLKTILPQHGSIIGGDDVMAALDYLDQLQCGTDIIYPHLSI